MRVHQTRYANATAALASNRRVLYMDRKNASRQQTLEETLASAVQASDTELDQILHEVDRISSALKSKDPDQDTARAAGHPAVWSAVKQALLDRELRYLALTDDLTCLYNRRGFFAAASQQLKHARRNSETLLLFFCDVDNLKKINDTFGHQEGDLALIRAADALEQTFRGSDVLGRLGGDEFVVLALQTSQTSEETMLHRLEKCLKKANGPGSAYSLSLSIGVARFDPKKAVSLGELLARADEAMYEKKRKSKLLVKAGT